MQTMELKLFSVKQVAALFGKHPETIKKWIRAGHLRATRAGPNGKYIIPQDSIDDFLNRSRDEDDETP